MLVIFHIRTVCRPACVAKNRVDFTATMHQPFGHLLSLLRGPEQNYLVAMAKLAAVFVLYTLHLELAGVFH